eukprot:gb/GECG01007080.1/.p1 GENE.gb/GECG01007080.1/~~gb/GECG01007080.1/.p1  ORF type:complete len:107 (+),score=7.74 gb/GECG01007080.1/:1-321(+)
MLPLQFDNEALLLAAMIGDSASTEILLHRGADPETKNHVSKREYTTYIQAVYLARLTPNSVESVGTSPRSHDETSWSRPQPGQQRKGGHRVARPCKPSTGILSQVI